MWKLKNWEEINLVWALGGLPELGWPAKAIIANLWAISQSELQANQSTLIATTNRQCKQAGAIREARLSAKPSNVVSKFCTSVMITLEISVTVDTTVRYLVQKHIPVCNRAERSSRYLDQNLGFFFTC